MEIISWKRRKRHTYLRFLIPNWHCFPKQRGSLPPPPFSLPSSLTLPQGLYYCKQVVLYVARAAPHPTINHLVSQLSSFDVRALGLEKVARGTAANPYSWVLSELVPYQVCGSCGCCGGCLFVLKQNKTKQHRPIKSHFVNAISLLPCYLTFVWNMEVYASLIWRKLCILFFWLVIGV